MLNRAKKSKITRHKVAANHEDQTRWNPLDATHIEYTDTLGDVTKWGISGIT